MNILSRNQFLPFIIAFPFRATHYHHHIHHATPFNTRRNQRKALKFSAQIDNSPKPTNTQQETNLSVLRFTFGIPWLDESYLPRWIGYGFGSLIVLNHFVGSNSMLPSAQIISEALGLSLAAFSITLPFVGRFLKGATQEEVSSIPESAQQIFVMSQNTADSLKEDLAWTSYVLLRNTKSVSVLISLQDVICIRGYWNTPENLSKDEIVYWFKSQIKKYGLSDVKDPLYFPQKTGSLLEEAIPDETGSILIQPVLNNSTPIVMGEDVPGFFLLASSINYAYGDKDRLWIQAITNKFRVLAEPNDTHQWNLDSEKDNICSASSSSSWNVESSKYGSVGSLGS